HGTTSSPPTRSPPEPPAPANHWPRASDACPPTASPTSPRTRSTSSSTTPTLRCWHASTLYAGPKRSPPASLPRWLRQPPHGPRPPPGRPPPVRPPHARPRPETKSRVVYWGSAYAISPPVGVGGGAMNQNPRPTYSVPPAIENPPATPPPGLSVQSSLPSFAD